MKTRLFLLVCALGLVSALGTREAGAAPPAIEIPISVKVTVKVPGDFSFKFVLVDDAGVARWSEEMNPAGAKKRLTTTTLTHLLGTLWKTYDAVNDPLDTALFEEQLRLRVYRWDVLKRKWISCMSPLKLNVVPYAAWSAISSAAGEGVITTYMIQDGAVTGDKIGSDAVTETKIRAGAVTLDKLGFSCPEGQGLVFGLQGWACGTALTCQEGDFLYCFGDSLDKLNVGICRPGTRACNADGTGFDLECAGVVLPTVETCNGKDDDCNGVVDDAADGTLLYKDEDGDGFGDSAVSRRFCDVEQPGWVAQDGDCAATDSAVYPGAREVCDNKDTDCNGQIDDHCFLPGECSNAELNAIEGCIYTCSPDLEFIWCAQDCVSGNVGVACDDAFALFLACYQQSCDFFTYDPGCAITSCGDQYNLLCGSPGECDYGKTLECGTDVGACAQGTRACDAGRWSPVCAGEIKPAFEICGNTEDEDCDGSTTDQDPEVCDGQDNDCDGVADNNGDCIIPPGPLCPNEKTAFDACVTGCQTDAGCVVNCRQTSLSPACVEAASDEIAQLADCFNGACSDGEIFVEDCFTNAQLCKAFYDAIFVGTPGECVHGTSGTCGPTETVGACHPGTRMCNFGVWSPCEGAVFPEAEVCDDDIDNDCDSATDEEVPAYADNDGDGYGTGEPQLLCLEQGWAAQGGDCDDENPEINPGMPEEICNGTDEDCDPATPDLHDVDADADGHSACEDCDESNPDIHNDAEETCDGLDNNCNELVDEGCPYCGDGTCDELSGEDQSTCPQDCAPSEDADADGIMNSEDNCPFTPNPDQADNEGDLVGDVCDICPFIYNPDQDISDMDGDTLPDDCDPDLDGDGVPNGSDNCPAVPNPDQTDSDSNGVGDVCEEP